MNEQTLNDLCTACEEVLTTTPYGKFRLRLVGKSRHRGVVMITIAACADIKPEADKPLRTKLCRERASYEVRQTYGFAWWILPLMEIILAVIQWWIKTHTKPAPECVSLK